MYVYVYTVNVYVCIYICVYVYLCIHIFINFSVSFHLPETFVCSSRRSVKSNSTFWRSHRRYKAKLLVATFPLGSWCEFVEGLTHPCYGG